MKINPEIFKAYDIRGVYPKELDEKTAYFIGRAFVEFLKKPNAKIAVGRDNRLSGPILRKHLVRGITDSGGLVVDIGLSPTPLLYFCVANYNLDGGINITASHNPAAYNGFKITREKAIPVSEKTGLKEIKTIADCLVGLKKLNPAERRGEVVKKGFIKDYINFNFKGAAASALKPLKIVVDTANAVSGVLIPEFFKNTPIRVFSLFAKLDGRFPNHSPDPLIKENLKFLQKEVLRKKADLGIAFDGDGDRIMFVDERGEIIPADFITAIMAEIILKNSPGKKILYDIRSSNIIKETIKKFSGLPLVGRVGHSFIKEKMRKENIVFAGEFSGHYYSKEHYFCEAPFFVLLSVLKEISKSGNPLSGIIKSFKTYFHSGEINFRVVDKANKIKELEKKYKGGTICLVDGLRIDFKDWWFNVRPSNTESLLRMVVEAKSKELMEKKKKELSALIEK